MSPFVAVMSVSLAVSAFGAEAVPERIQRQFTSDDYTVSWGSAAAGEPNADLEIGNGGGHGGPLRWMRFRPGKTRLKSYPSSSAAAGANTNSGGHWTTIRYP